jgi:hypothetical protein
MDTATVKRLWVQAVRAMLKEDYHVSKKWESTFRKAAEILNGAPHIDPKDFIRCQIQYLIDTNHLDVLWPNILLGDSMTRFYNQKPLRLRVEDAVQSFKGQFECFRLSMETMGIRFALENTLHQYHALFLIYIRLLAKQEIPDELRAAARTELARHPELYEVLPKNFYHEQAL